MPAKKHIYFFWVFLQQIQDDEQSDWFMKMETGKDEGNGKHEDEDT